MGQGNGRRRPESSEDRGGKRTIEDGGREKYGLKRKDRKTSAEERAGKEITEWRRSDRSRAEAMNWPKRLSKLSSFTDVQNSVCRKGHQEKTKWGIAEEGVNS
eukprot:jgi/Psemu1/38079/gm1.38079_g